jgi:HSP20 family molecular chaperone IbpA
MVELMTKKQGNGEMTQPESTRGGQVFIPNVDIIEKQDELLVITDVPGAKAENVEVTYEKGILEFRAHIEPRQDASKVNYIFREYTTGDYQRSFRLGEHLDPGNIQAEITDGVLTIRIAKRPELKSKVIEVKSK